MRDTHGKFIWYELLTTDLDDAAGFYEKLLGWKSSDSGQSSLDYRLFSMNGQAIGGAMAITADMAAGGARPGWLGYICVDDVDASARAIAEDGATICMEPRDIPDIGRFAMFIDPQGVPLYMMTPLPQEGESSSFDRSMPGHCSWNELATSNQEAAFEFYSRAFGWKKSGEMDMGAMGIYQFIAHGDQGIGAMCTNPSGAPPNWNYYFRVENIDEAAKTIASGGGQVLMGPHEVPDGDWIILGKDPQGASLALVGAKNGE